MIHFQSIEACYEHYVISCHPTFELFTLLWIIQS